MKLEKLVGGSLVTGGLMGVGLSQYGLGYFGDNINHSENFSWLGVGLCFLTYYLSHIPVIGGFLIYTSKSIPKS